MNWKHVGIIALGFLAGTLVVGLFNKHVMPLLSRTLPQVF